MYTHPVQRATSLSRDSYNKFERAGVMMWIANSPFYSWPIEDVMNSGEMYPRMEARMKFVIGKINAQAEKHGEYYVLGKLEKVVDMSYFRTDLLTFTVKQVVPNPDVVKTVQTMVFHAGNLGFQLREWRFKPQQPMAFPTAASTSSITTS